MKRGVTLLLLLAACWCVAAPARASDATVSTFWPFFDYRASESADYQSLHMLGPFLKYETKGPETEYALRPLFYRAVDDQGESSTDVLYPLFGARNKGDSSNFNLFHLLSYDFGEKESGSRNRSYLFPFFFYGEEEQGGYGAFFPVGGTLYNWFGRDRITFFLFPLYGQTERNGTTIDNVLWPFFARISGENESGYKFWPLFGQSSKEGVYEKSFFLWPIFFSESLKQDTDEPEERRAAWPFYVSKETPKKSTTFVLWPFFSRTEDREKDYLSWDAPWPLVRVTEGEKYHGERCLPFFADETRDAYRKRWYFWPIYKIEELKSDLIDRRRDRVLFFLYSDIHETRFETGQTKRRIDFWPLFGYKRINGVSSLHVLSLLEPLFPDNEGIERLWAPLWRVYQQKWDEQGNRVVSLLWNLYWYEKQGNRVAWELFPLLEYRDESANDQEFSFLKGLLRYRSTASGKQLNLFYTSWGLRWGTPSSGKM